MVAATRPPSDKRLAVEVCVYCKKEHGHVYENPQLWLDCFCFVLAASYLSWVTRCCSKGRRKAQTTNDPTSCNSDDLNRRRFRNVIDRVICRHSERICCVKEMQKLSCQSGKYEAS